MEISEKGKKGEDFACEYLRKLGYEIIDRNWHSRYGEIDIIARKDEYIVFVEVKTRQYNAIVSGAMAVNYRKQKKIVLTSALYLLDVEEELQPRYDVIEVRLSGDNICGIQHYEGAFNTEGILY